MEEILEHMILIYNDENLTDREKLEAIEDYLRACVEDLEINERIEQNEYV